MKYNLLKALLFSVILNVLMPFIARSQVLPLSTNSDSAISYYYQGWEQVLDYGHFTNSEIAYRKMYTHDPEFLVGASLLARITTDPQERKQLIANTERNASRLDGDEALLLELFLNLARLYLYGEQGSDDLLGPHRTKTMIQAEETLRLIAAKYPDDLYYRSEYVEFLHANHGPQVALDTLYVLFPHPPPFMLGYSAQLLGELGRFEKAQAAAMEFASLMAGKEAPQVHIMYAKIYQKMGKKREALIEAQKALVIDPGQLIAQRFINQLTTHKIKK